MELIFENIAEVAQGSFPSAIQFPNTSAQIFTISGGSIFGTPIEKLDGDFSNPVIDTATDVSPDTGITNLSLQALSGFGAVGSYKTSNIQKLIIYELQHDVSKYLARCSIRHNIDTPVSSFRMTLKNYIDVDPDTPVIIGEKSSLLTPGSKVIFSFGMGDDFTDYPMGTFYTDHTNFSVLAANSSVDGRNLIGKALKDQTLNQNRTFPYDILSNIITTILDNANLEVDQYEVEYDASYRGYSFEPNKDPYSALEEIFRSMIDWKMEETVEGEIIIGSADYGLFPERSTYTFYRDKDIFTRDISMDDQDAYRKVCVHTGSWGIEVYAEVNTFSGWNLNSNKTLFVEVAEGISLENATSIVNSLAARLENVGKVESFEGPFRPYLLTGDQAVIVDNDGSTNLGLITDIEHSGGEDGFGTSFTVDSGGTIGKGRLSDYIKKLDKVKTKGSIWYDDIPAE